MDLKDFSGVSPDIQAGEILRAIEVAISPEATSDRSNTDLRPFAPVTHFAFDSWDEAHNFWKAIVGKHCTRAKVGRVSDSPQPWEVKTWNMRQDMLEKLIRAQLLAACSRCTHAQELPPVRRD